MDWYESEVQALERRVSSEECPVVFYGSSSIRLWPCLEERFGVSNRGFGGSTLEACAHFFERLVVSLNPRSLVVYAGDNDLGDGRAPEQVLDAFRKLTGKIERELPGVPFGFISIKLSPARVAIRDRIERANQLIAEEIERHPAGYLISIYQAMLDSEGLPRPELFLSDGLHMSAAGYRVWEQLLNPYKDRIFTPHLAKCNRMHLFLNHGEPGVQKVV